MKIASVSEIQNLDKQTIETLGIPSLVLMERAALGVFSIIENQFADKKYILIAVGSGNNGGDGLALARMLTQKGIRVEVFVFGDESKSSKDNLIQLSICKSLGITIKPYSLGEFKEHIKYCDLIVDALFGVGLTRDITGNFAEAISEINLSYKPVIAIDIPSGIDGDNGKMMGIACRANHTVTFALPKYGLLMDNSIDNVGKISIIDIGIPYSYAEFLKGNLLDIDEIRKIIPVKRKLNTHKGTYGKVLILAGSKMMSGAAVLATKSALISGSGIVYTGVPASIRDVVAQSVPSAIVIPLPEDEEGRLCLNSYDEIVKYLGTVDALAIGPGIGVTDELGKLLEKIFANFRIPSVIDADGLNNLANLEEFKFDSNVILTPHAGELSRLINKNIHAIQEHRFLYAHQAAEKFNSIMVLKGARTIIMNKYGINWINVSGNPGMAKGGSGDVLTGLMVGLLGQGLHLIDAAKTAVYWHGKAGDIAAEKKGQNCMIIEDLISHLADAYRLFKTVSN